MKNLTKKESTAIQGGHFNLDIYIKHLLDRLNKGICDPIWGCQGPPQAS